MWSRRPKLAAVSRGTLSSYSEYVRDDFGCIQRNCSNGHESRSILLQTYILFTVYSGSLIHRCMMLAEEEPYRISQTFLHGWVPGTCSALTGAILIETYPTNGGTSNSHNLGHNPTICFQRAVSISMRARLSLFTTSRETPITSDKGFLLLP